MTIQTITHLDALKIASGSQTVIEMIEKITTNGSLNNAYEYLYSDLFVVFNRIYNNGPGLNNSLSTSLRDEINHDFERMHYHISVAEGLAAGIITAPGVGPEVSNAKDWSTKAQNNIKKLNDNASAIIQSDETRRYVLGLQTATNDPALNVDQLIKQLFWTIIVNLGKVNATKDDFEGKIAEIHLGLLKLKSAGWQGYFDLEGLKINLDQPGTDDDLDKVQSALGTTGEIVGVLSAVVMVYNWKASGVKPGRFFSSVIQKFTSFSAGEAAETVATSAAVEAEAVEVSALEAFGDVLGLVGLLLAVIGGIIEAVQLDKELDKINAAKANFNASYAKLVANVEGVVQASEGIRKHTN